MEEQADRKSLRQESLHWSRIADHQSVAGTSDRFSISLMSANDRLPHRQLTALGTLRVQTNGGYPVLP